MSYLHCAPKGAKLRDPNPDPRRLSSYVSSPRPDDAVAIQQAGRHASEALRRTGSMRCAYEVGEDYLRDERASYAALLALPSVITTPDSNCQCDRCGTEFYLPSPRRQHVMCGSCIADRYL